MKKMSLAILLCYSSNVFAGANYAEVPLRVPAVNVILYVPYEAPTAECRLVTPWTPDKPRPVALVHQTFVDNFDTLDITSKSSWAPHFDGGWNETTQQFQGYDWHVKRYQPVSNEEQIYTDPLYKGTSRTPLGLNPFSIQDSILTITTDLTPADKRQYLYNHKYTSGLLSSHKMFGQVYGYFEISAKVPKSVAMLPAFWLRDDRNWPPEIDVYEMPGHQPNTISYGSHWRENDKSGSSGCKPVNLNYSEGFHTYGVLWTPERIVYYFDRVAVAQIATRPSQSIPLYLTINSAIGGSWQGYSTESTPIPVKMEVDWVAAYSASGLKGCLTDSRFVKICR